MFKAKAKKYQINRCPRLERRGNTKARQHKGSTTPRFDNTKARQFRPGNSDAGMLVYQFE